MRHRQFRKRTDRVLCFLAKRSGADPPVFGVGCKNAMSGCDWRYQITWADMPSPRYYAAEAVISEFDIVRTLMWEDDRLQVKRDWAKAVDTILERKGWRPADLAAACGVSRSCVQRWRTGNTKVGTIPRSAGRQALRAIGQELGLLN